MGDLVRLVRPDGTTLQVSAEQAARLKLLDYREQTPEEQTAEAAMAGQEAYYSTPGQKLKTVGEGLGRGLTFGATDYLFGDEDTAARAKFNPGYSMASEFLGALAPLALTGPVGAAGEAGLGARIAGATPVMQLTRGVESAVAATGLTGRTARVVGGALEGGVWGATGAADHAYLADDPLTVEAVLHGAGYGSLFGGAFSAAGEVFTSAAGRMEAKAAARKAAGEAEITHLGTEAELTLKEAQLRLAQAEQKITTTEAEIAAHKEAVDAAVTKIGSSENELQTAIKREQETLATPLADLSVETRNAVELASSALLEKKAAADAAEQALREAQDRYLGVTAGARAEAKTQQKVTRMAIRDAKDPIITMGNDAYAALRSEASNFATKTQNAHNLAKALIKQGGDDALNAAVAGKVAPGRAKQLVAAVNEARTSANNMIRGLSDDVLRAHPEALKLALDDYTQAVARAAKTAGVSFDAGAPGRIFDEMLGMAETVKTLNAMPRTMEAFISMKPKRAEDMFAALEKAKTLSAYPELAAAIEGSANKLSSALGLETNGLAGLRDAYHASRATVKAARFENAAAAKEAIKAAAAKKGERAADAIKTAAELKQLQMDARRKLADIKKQLSQAQTVHRQAMTAAAKEARSISKASEKAKAIVAEAREDAEGALLKAQTEAEKKAKKLNTEESKIEALALKRERRIIELRKTEEALRNPKPKSEAEGGMNFFQRYGVYQAVKSATGSTVLGLGASYALAGMRNAILGRLRSAVTKWAPTALRKTGTAFVKYGPKIDPLARKLDGTLDESTKDRRELAKRRIKELWDAYPAVNDTLYRGVSALGIDQPKLAASAHAAAVNGFKEVLRTVPRDPGTVSGLRSIWSPSDMQAEQLSRRLAVFHDPIGETEQMLASGQFDPIKIKTLKVVAPAIYQETRVGMMERLADPEVMKSMTYNDQIGVGAMLDIPIHSSLRPEHIASSQQLFQQRRQPLPMPKQMDQSGRVGRPAENNPYASESQKITEH